MGQSERRGYMTRAKQLGHSGPYNKGSEEYWRSEVNRLEAQLPFSVREATRRVVPQSAVQHSVVHHPAPKIHNYTVRNTTSVPQVQHSVVHNPGPEYKTFSVRSENNPYAAFLEEKKEEHRKILKEKEKKVNKNRKKNKKKKKKKKSNIEPLRVLENNIPTVGEQKRQFNRIKLENRNPDWKPKEKEEKEIDLLMNKINNPNVKKVVLVEPDYYTLNFTDNQAAFNSVVNQERTKFSGRQVSGKILRERYFNNIRSLEDIKQAVDTVHQEQKHAYKIQIYMGVVTETIGDKNRRTPYIWKNDRNNFTHLFETDGVQTPLTINNNSSYRATLAKITKRQILASALRVIKQSQVRIMGIYNIMIKVFRTDVAMGCQVEIPDYIKKNRNIHTLSDLQGKLCFWACLALSKGARRDRYIRPAKQLFEEYYGVKPSADYQGVHIQSDLEAIEEKFEIAINVYSWDGEFVHLDRRSIVPPKNGTLTLLAYKNHFMYVKDIQQVAKSFRCDTCSMVFSSGFRLNEHASKCTARVKETFSKYGELYKPAENVIIQIAKMLGVYKPGQIDFAYDYHAVFDYEAILKNIEEPPNDQPAKVHKVSIHVPVSCSDNSNVPGFGVRFFCVTDYENTYEMNKAIYEHFLSIQAEAYKLMKKKIERIFECKFDDLVEKLENEYSQKRLAKALIGYVKQLPVLNFNGAMYDINLNKKHGLLSLMASDGGGIEFAAKKANRYMSIGTARIKMLDITNYLPPGWSYEQYVKAYECKLAKGFYPYEWCDHENKLLETQLPPVEAFYSKLKSANTLGNDDATIQKNYEMLQQVWRGSGMKNMRDFLEWYNNLDVIPFVEAVDKQKAFYIEHELDMFKDAVSIPGLAEKIMFREARLSAEAKGRPEKHKYAKISPELIQKRIDGYLDQDHKADRSCKTCLLKVTAQEISPHVKSVMPACIADLIAGYAEEIPDETCNGKHEYKKADYLDEKHAYELLEEANYRCHYCYTNIGESRTQDEKYALSYDRIDCSKPHIKGNLRISCVHCNVSRSNTDYHTYYARTEMKRLNAVSPQIKLISEANKEVFHKLKKNVVGGPSIIFHRYHEAEKTHIRRPRYNESTNQWTVSDEKKVKKIVGFDANALYLWALSQNMPCGEMKLIETDDMETTLNQIKNGTLFGFAEVDIHTPTTLYNKFGEFPPIFRNDTIKEDQLGDYMKQVRKDLDKPVDEKNKKLISSYTGEKILLYTPLLKWYLDHGLVVTKIHSFIKATANNPFKTFTEKVSDNRREGDKDKSKTIIAEAWKLTGNSAFGRTGMDKNRHVSTKYVDDIYKAKRKVNNWLFRDLNEIECEGGSTVFECSSGKKQIKQNCPLQVASAVYQLAKLRMLEFYYDCLDKFVDRSDFQYVEMDTDSAYMAITGDSIETMIKPDMKETFEKEQYDWFPDNRTAASKALTKRTPGLFKVEWEGTGIVALTSKMYFCHGEKTKSSAKGIQMRNNASLLTFENYKACLFNKEVIQANNRGFRVWDGQVYTYEQGKDGLSPIYDKRVLLEDGITSIPIGNWS